MSEAAVPLTVNDLLEMSREAPSVMLHPATMDSALQRVAENMVLPSSREKYDSLAVRTLLEELLKAMNSSPTGEASSTEGQEPPPPTPPLAAKGVTYPAHITSKGQKSLPGNGERVGEAVTEAAANEQQVRDTVWEYGLEAPHANVVMTSNKPVPDTDAFRKQQQQPQQDQDLSSHRRRRGTSSSANRVEPGNFRRGAVLRAKRFQQDASNP